MRIVARFPGACARCGTPLAVGDTIRWDPDKGTVRCGRRCRPAAVLAHQAAIRAALVEAVRTEVLRDGERWSPVLADLWDEHFVRQLRHTVPPGRRRRPDRARDRERSRAAEARRREDYAAAGLDLRGRPLAAVSPRD